MIVFEFQRNHQSGGYREMIKVAVILLLEKWNYFSAWQNLWSDSQQIFSTCVKPVAVRWTREDRAECTKQNTLLEVQNDFEAPGLDDQAHGNLKSRFRSQCWGTELRCWWCWYSISQCRFDSCKLYIPYTSLLMLLGKKRKTAQVTASPPSVWSR